MTKIDGAMRTLEAIADGNDEAYLTPTAAGVIWEYVRALEERLQAPLVQGQDESH